MARFDRFSGQYRVAARIAAVIFVITALWTAFRLGTERDVLPMSWLGHPKGDLPPKIVTGGPDHFQPQVPPTGDNLKLPPGVKVIAVLFFGRKETVQVLECYLRVSRAILLPRDNPPDLQYFLA
jgi:hypothetical protein